MADYHSNITEILKTGFEKFGIPKEVYIDDGCSESNVHNFKKQYEKNSFSESGTKKT